MSGWSIQHGVGSTRALSPTLQLDTIAMDDGTLIVSLVRVSAVGQQVVIVIEGEERAALLAALAETFVKVESGDVVVRLDRPLTCGVMMTDGEFRMCGQDATVAHAVRAGSVWNLLPICKQHAQSLAIAYGVVEENGE